MSSSLTIKNLNEKTAGSSPISYEFMPQPPFRLIVCGPSHSGKSNMIKKMITIKELHCFMRYNGFAVTEKPRDDIESKGIVVRMRGWST